MSNNNLDSIAKSVCLDLIDLSSVIVESDNQINIDNDTDFISLGFPGDGTPGNPYRIENKSIIIDDFSPGIRILATTKHFIIQNCYFEKLTRGIELSYVASNTSIIRNNTFKYHRLTAISILSTNYTRIENNIGRNIMEGIYTYNSYFPFIVNNTFLGCYDYDGMLNPSGMKLYRSYNGTIINNTISNFEQGIYTRDSSGFLIENNTCLYCRYEGSISLYLSSNMIVKRNLIYHNLQWAGIFLRETNNCEIMYNTIYHCALWGIALVGSDNNMVYHNNLIDNTITTLNNQAFDNGINNTWYLWNLEEGNFWSDWSGIGSYEIDGSVPSYNFDIYPLSDLYEFDLDDLYLPNTTNDDSYEENDYTFNNPEIALSITHDLHYADVDFFRINLQKSWKYRFTIEFNFNIIDLDFYLLEEEFDEAVFNPLNYSNTRNNNEQFTYIAPDYGYYYLLVIGDLEHYRDIIPSDYQLTITTLAHITPTTTTTSNGILMNNWFVIIATIFIITFCKRIYSKYRNMFQK